MRGRIGLNIASILPWSAMPLVGLLLAAEVTREAGYSFWQVLPLRNVSVKGLRRAGIPVRFVESDWNPTTFRRHFSGRPSPRGAETKLHDPLFFPDPEKCRRVFGEILSELGAKSIYHDIVAGRSGLVEFHRGLKESIQELADFAGDGKPFVLDTLHVRQTVEHERIHFDQACPDFCALLPFTRLIHVQAWGAEEWQGFVCGEETELRDLLATARNSGYLGPFVVEFDPRAFGPLGLLPWNLTKNLRRVRERVEEVLR